MSVPNYDTESAMLSIMRWLAEDNYRVVIHIHDGTYKAIDELGKMVWKAPDIKTLAELLNAARPERDANAMP